MLFLIVASNLGSIGHIFIDNLRLVELETIIFLSTQTWTSYTFPNPLIQFLETLNLIQKNEPAHRFHRVFYGHEVINKDHLLVLIAIINKIHYFLYRNINLVLPYQVYVSGHSNQIPCIPSQIRCTLSQILAFKS